MRRKFWVVTGGLAGVAVLGSLVPFLLKRLFSLALRRSPYRGRVSRVRVQPIRGTLAMTGIDLVPVQSGASVPAAHVDQALFRLNWRELARGGLVLSIDLERPVVLLRASNGKNPPASPDRKSPVLSGWNKKVRHLFPAALSRVAIHDGAVCVRNIPGQDGADIRLNDVNLVAQGISNSERYAPDLKAEIQGSARVMSTGQLLLSADAYPLADHPTFNADVELRGLDLRDVGDFIRSVTGADVRSGRADLVAEAAAADGNLVGYAKPIVDGLRFHQADGSEKHDAIRYAALRAVTKALTNKKEDRIAARVDFSGRIDDPSVGVIPAVKSVLKNAFANALSPALEGTVRLPTSTPPSRVGKPGETSSAPTHRVSKMKAAFAMLKDTATRWSDDNAPRLGASLSYYTAFSLAPLLLLAISLAGLIFGRAAVQGRVMDQLGTLMGPESARAIQGMIQAAYKPASGTIAAIVGFVTLLFGASGVMTELKNALNQIWRVKEKSGFKTLVRDRLLSFGMVLVIGFLLLVSLVISAAVAAMGRYFQNLLPIPAFFLEMINNVVSFGVVLLLFAALFKALPDAKIRWPDVWIGAGITALLFTLGKFLIGLYIGKTSVASSYGAAGSVLVMLLWIYYSALILYFGAEFTRIYADRYGSGVKPSNASLSEKIAY